jgi:uncharacterized protein YwgA
VASPDKRLKDRELVLLVADAAGGKLEGRTVAQKLAYFAGWALEQPTGHTPYFYGPFSSDIEAALNRLVMAGDLDETIERLPAWSGGSDVLKHVYMVTDRGAEAVKSIREDRAAEAEIVDSIVSALKQAVPELRQKTLSAAAKIHYVVAERHRPVSDEEVRTIAKGLGWRLNARQVERTADLLAGLGLLVRTP